MKKRIWIMDDLHWKEIYQDLKVMTSWYIFPIKKDIYDPLPYLSKLKDWDIVLLDNYFDWWDSPLWNEFLKSYLETNLKCDIIAISDVWEKLTEKFEYRNKANKNDASIDGLQLKKVKISLNLLINIIQSKFFEKY